MGLHRFKPTPSGRMGVLWTLSTIKEACVVEYGCMGHMLYSGVTLKRTGVNDGCKLYSTHMNEADISFGDTTRLEKVISNVIKRDNPKALFLTPASVPEVIGTDIGAICKELQSQYKETKLIAFNCGGFNIYSHKGVRETLHTLVKTLPQDRPLTKELTFNIIGSCADFFRFQADVEEIKRVLKGAFDMEPVCVLSSDATVTDIQNMGSAHINIVIRHEGEKAAKELEKQFNTPYFVGRPYGVKGTTKWLKEISEILNIDINQEFVSEEESFARSVLINVIPMFKQMARMYPRKATISLGGHVDIVQGIMSYACDELSFVKGDTWCDDPKITNSEIPFLPEAKWSEIVKNHERGWLMASGEALEWAGKDTSLQISNPDTKWRINPYEPPLIGYRGAINLANIWINTADND